MRWYLFVSESLKNVSTVLSGIRHQTGCLHLNVRWSTIVLLIFIFSRKRRCYALFFYHARLKTLKSLFNSFLNPKFLMVGKIRWHTLLFKIIKYMLWYSFRHLLLNVYFLICYEGFIYFLFFRLRLRNNFRNQPSKRLFLCYYIL